MGVGVVVQQVKLLLGTPASHIIVQVQVLVPLLPIQLPTNALGRQVNDDSDTWVPATHMGVLNASSSL